MSDGSSPSAQDEPEPAAIHEVWSQPELDRELARAGSRDLLVCLGSATYRVVDPPVRLGAYDDAHLVASGTGDVHVAGRATAELAGSVQAIAYAHSRVSAAGVTQIEARGQSTVTAREHASVVASDRSTVDAADDTLVIALDAATVEARGRAIVEWYTTAEGTPTVVLHEDAQGHDGGTLDPSIGLVDRVAGEAAAFAEERLTLLRRRITG